MTDKTPAKVEEKKTVRKRRSYKRARRLRFKIDTLPPEASQAVKRVQDRLRDGRDTQQVILFDLHSDLLALGIKTKISKSSMSNYAKWFAAQGHEIMAIRNFADIIAERVDTVEGSNVELYIGELIKAGVAKAVKAMLDDDKPDMTALRDAATALYRLARARETSLESRRLILKEIGERVDEIGKERGLSAKSIKDFKSMLRIPTKDGESEEPENDQ